MSDLKHDWTIEEIKEIHDKSFLELVFEAATEHRKFHDPKEVQVSSLISIKTGGLSRGLWPIALKLPDITQTLKLTN